MRAEPEIRPQSDVQAEPATEPVLDVVVQWGGSVLCAEHVNAPGELLLGDDERALLALDLAAHGVERLVLAHHDGVDAALYVPSALGARAWIDGVEIDPAQLAADGKVPLAEGASGCLEVCGLTVYVQPTRAVRDASLRALQPARLAQPWTLASLGVHLAVLGLFYVLPPHSQALNIGDVDRNSRLISFVMDAREHEPEVVLEKLEASKEPGGNAGKAAAGDPGEIGDPNAPRVPKRVATRGSSETPSIAATPEDARNAGIIRLLSSSLPTLKSLFTAEYADGSDLEDALGKIVGDQIGASQGLRGLAMIGTGRGGGGDGAGTLGSGPLGTIGGGRGGGGGLGYGRGAGTFTEHVARVPRLRAEPPDVHGGLAKEVIRRVVHRHLAEVRHCYEQRLIARPDLQGRVVVRFIIGSTGAVAASVVEKSDLGDQITDLCIAAAVKRWTFPVPDGAGIVSVGYPFALQQAQ